MELTEGFDAGLMAASSRLFLVGGDQRRLEGLGEGDETGAAAERNGCPLVTGDARIAKAAGIGCEIMLLDTGH